MAFFAPLLFLWGKRGTHLKEEKKTSFSFCCNSQHLHRVQTGRSWKHGRGLQRKSKGRGDDRRWNLTLSTSSFTVNILKQNGVILLPSSLWAPGCWGPRVGSKAPSSSPLLLKPWEAGAHLICYVGLERSLAGARFGVFPPKGWDLAQISSSIRAGAGGGGRQLPGPPGVRTWHGSTWGHAGAAGAAVGSQELLCAVQAGDAVNPWAGSALAQRAESPVVCLCPQCGSGKRDTGGEGARLGWGCRAGEEPACSLCLPGDGAGSCWMHRNSAAQRRNESAWGAVASSLQGVWGAASTVPWPLLAFKPANSPGPWSTLLGCSDKTWAELN